MQAEKIFIWEQNERKVDEFYYLWTLTNSLLVA